MGLLSELLHQGYLWSSSSIVQTVQVVSMSERGLLFALLRQGHLWCSSTALTLFVTMHEMKAL